MKINQSDLKYSPIYRLLNGWHPCRKLGTFVDRGERGFYVEATDLASSPRRFAAVPVSMLDADSPLCPLPPVVGEFADQEKGVIWLKLEDEDFTDRID